MGAAVTFVIIAFGTLILGYPVAGLVSHGLDPALWPAPVIPPAEWFGYLPSYEFAKIFTAYWQMLIGRSRAFQSGGFFHFIAILAPAASGPS